MTTKTVTKAEKLAVLQWTSGPAVRLAAGVDPATLLRRYEAARRAECRARPDRAPSTAATIRALKLTDWCPTSARSLVPRVRPRVGELLEVRALSDADRARPLVHCEHCHRVIPLPAWWRHGCDVPAEEV
jgi:hypothetical protein